MSLAVASQLARLMGGDLGECAAGYGYWLNIRLEKQVGIECLNDWAGRYDHITAVVLDDDVRSRQILLHMLSRLGMQICVADSSDKCAEILKRLKHIPVDLVIADTRAISEVDAAQTRIVREMERGGTQLLLLEARQTAPNLNCAGSAAARMSKPVVFHRLAEKLSLILE